MLNMLHSISVAESLVCVMNTVLYSFEDSCTLFESFAYMFWLKVPIGTLTFVHVKNITDTD